MVTVEKSLIDEFVECLHRQGFSQKDLAEMIHVTKSAVSNWVADGLIPRDRLLDVVEALDDERFKFITADYLLHMHLIVSNDFANDPLSQFKRWQKEETERKLLNEQLEIILAKQKPSPNEREFVRNFIKEFDEERQAENDFAIAVQSIL